MIESGRVKKSDLKAIIAKGLMPYRGIGSGIKRELEAWPEIDFIDDRDGCQFNATVHRKTAKSSVIGSVDTDGSPKSSSISSPKSSVKTEDRILDLIEQDNVVTTELLGKLLGISKRAVLKQIAKLKKQGRLHRIGPAKGGRWDVRR